MFAASKSGKTTAVAPSTTDTYFPYVPLLLETGASSSRSTTVVDSSTNNFTVTRNGAPSTGWVSPYQTNGYWGNVFNGSPDNLITTAMTAAGTGSVTYECWFNARATSGVILNSRSGDTTDGIDIQISSSSKIQITYSFVILYTSTLTIALNAWYHVAVVRNGTTNWTVFINGQIDGTFSNTVNISSTTFTVANGASGSFYLNGYVSNVRVVNSAVYTGVFTPSTTPLTAITNTQILTCYSNRFIDSNTATTAKTITVNGTPQVSGYWYPSTFTAPTASPGAGLFNGTADYLSTPANAAFQLTGDFTIEAWINISSFPGAYAMLVGSAATATTDYFAIRSSNQIELGIGGSSATFPTWSFTWKFNTWYHIAITRSGTALSAYVNGTALSGSQTSSAQFFNTGSGLQIGRYGVTAAPYYFNGYISNLRIVKGTAVYTGNFTPPTLAFLQTSGSASASSYSSTTNVNTSFAAANTSLLVNLADSNYVSATNGVQNNTFVDNSNYAFPITRNGSATQGSVTPYWPNGYWGNYFGTANTDYLSVTSSAVLAFGTGAYTVEFWVYLPVYNNPNRIIDLGSAAGSFGVQINNTGTIAITKFGSADVFTSSAGFTLNTWNHVAVVRTSTAASGTAVYLNGSSLGTTTDANNWTVVTTPRISSSSFGFVGYVSNLRVVKGVAVYTGAFTPPTTPLASTQSSGTNIAAITGTATSLLACQSNRFVDNSSNSLAITPSGTPRVQAFQPLSPVASYTPAAYGGSGYFSGASGEYLNTVANAAFNFGTNNFTVEGWVYPTGTLVSNNMPIVEIRTTTGATGFVFLRTANALTLNVYTNSAFGGVSTNSLTLNAWNHVALVRSTNTWSYYINGVASGSFTNTSSQTDGATTGPKIGGSNAAAEVWVGYLSNVRVVNGTAVYTGAFTPPTLAPLTAAGSTSAASYSSTTNVNTVFPSSSTSLLTNFSNAGIYDAAVQNDAITVGDAQGSTTQYKWSPTSMKFDGTGDYLSILNNPAFNLGTTFTIEFWVYRTVTTAQRVISRQDGTSPYNGYNISYGEVTAGSWTFDASGTQITFADSNINTWVYFAWVVNATSATVYRNGTSVGTATQTAQTPATNTTLLIGVKEGLTNYFNGYLQDLRITRGIARTATTPTAAFPTR